MKQSPSNDGRTADLSHGLSDVFVSSFNRVHSISKQIVHKAITPRDAYLRSLVDLALSNQTPTEYPFVFMYSYSGDQDKYATVEKLAAAVHLLQTSTFVIDDV